MSEIDKKIADLREACVCLYSKIESSIAKDVERKMLAVIDELKASRERERIDRKCGEGYVASCDYDEEKIEHRTKEACLEVAERMLKPVIGAQHWIKFIQAIRKLQDRGGNAISEIDKKIDKIERKGKMEGLAGKAPDEEKTWLIDELKASRERERVFLAITDECEDELKDIERRTKEAIKEYIDEHCEPEIEYGPHGTERWNYSRDDILAAIRNCKAGDD